MLKTSSAKIYDPEIKPINNDRSTEFQKVFDLTKQSEELIEPNRANNSEVSDIESSQSFSWTFCLLFLLCESAIQSANNATLFTRIAICFYKAETICQY